MDMLEMVEMQGPRTAELPQPLCIGPVLLFLKLTVPCGAYAPASPAHTATERKLLLLCRGR